MMVKKIWSKKAVELWLRKNFPDERQREIMKKLLFVRWGKMYAFKPALTDTYALKILNLYAHRHGDERLKEIVKRELARRKRMREIEKLNKVLREIEELDRLYASLGKAPIKPAIKAGYTR